MYNLEIKKNYMISLMLNYKTIWLDSLQLWISHIYCQCFTHSTNHCSSVSNPTTHQFSFSISIAPPLLKRVYGTPRWEYVLRVVHWSYSRVSPSIDWSRECTPCGRFDKWYCPLGIQSPPTEGNVWCWPSIHGRFL